MRRSIPVEDLCENCRQFSWDPFRSNLPGDPIDHHKSLCELRNSAKTGCRACQIFWLYIETEAKVDDDFELKFTWKSTHSPAQIMIEGSQFAMGTCTQTRGDSRGIQFPEDQLSMPSPKTTAGERCTTNKKFVAHISVYVGRLPLFEEIEPIYGKSNWGEGDGLTTLKRVGINIEVFFFFFFRKRFRVYYARRC